MIDLSDTDVIILCGGLGERLRPVIPDKPKVLAEIGDRAFLDIVMEFLLPYGFKNIILSVGYLKDQVINHFKYFDACNITFSEEDSPLWTGGALKKAEPLIKSNPFIVMNGDSICKVNLREFFEFHMKNKALLSIVLVQSDDVKEYGSVKLDETNKIMSFREKVQDSTDSMISAGIYIMQSDIFSYMPGQNRFSLEKDVFPHIISKGCYGFLTESGLIDIGTPERYGKAICLLGER